MTSTDILPSMPAAAAAATQANRVAGAGSQSNGQSGDEHGAFPNVLHKLAKDNDKGTANAAQEQATAGRPKETALARLRRLEAEKAGVKKPEQQTSSTAATDSDRDDDGTATDGDDLMALLQAASAGLQNPPQRDAKAKSTATETRQAATTGAEATASTADVDTAARANEVVRDVKVVSVKVETHHDAATGPVGAADFAQRLNAAKLGQAGEKRTDALPGKSSAPDAAASAAGTSDATTNAAAEPSAVRGRHAGANEERSFAGFDRSGHRQGAGTEASGSGARDVEATAAVAGTTTGGTVPGQVQSPTHQVGTRLVAVAEEMRQTATTTAADATSGQPTAGPVRVLSINLHPDDLGSVTVRMSMVGDALDVQIAAEQPDTARMLQSDSSQLTDMLRTAGVQVDGVTIRAASPDSVSGSAGSGQSFMDQQAQGQQGNAQSDARASSGNSRQQERQTYEGGGRARNEDEAGRRTAAGGLYV